MFVDTDDETAGPDEDQEGQEDRDEDGVAYAGHCDMEHSAAQELIRSRSGVLRSPDVPKRLITPNGPWTQLTAHTTIEVRGSEACHNVTRWTSHYFGQVARKFLNFYVLLK